jgi:hypothetical protein
MHAMSVRAKTALPQEYSTQWLEISAGRSLIVEDAAIGVNELLWAVLAAVPAGTHQGVLKVRRESPSARGGTLGMLLLKTRVFVNVAKLFGIDGPGPTLGAGVLDAVAQGNGLSAGLVLGLLRFMACSKLIDSEQREFLCLALDVLRKGDNPYRTPIPLAEIVARYEERGRHGAETAERIFKRLEAKGVIASARDSQQEAFVLVR